MLNFSKKWWAGKDPLHEEAKDRLMGALFMTLGVVDNVDEAKTFVDGLKANKRDGRYKQLRAQVTNHITHVLEEKLDREADVIGKEHKSEGADLRKELGEQLDAELEFTVKNRLKSLAEEVAGQAYMHRDRAANEWANEHWDDKEPKSSARDILEGIDKVQKAKSDPAFKKEWTKMVTNALGFEHQNVAKKYLAKVKSGLEKTVWCVAIAVGTLSMLGAGVPVVGPLIVGAGVVAIVGGVAGLVTGGNVFAKIGEFYRNSGIRDQIDKIRGRERPIEMELKYNEPHVMAAVQADYRKGMEEYIQANEKTYTRQKNLDALKADMGELQKGKDMVKKVKQEVIGSKEIVAGTKRLLQANEAQLHDIQTSNIKGDNKLKSEARKIKTELQNRIKNNLDINDKMHAKFTEIKATLENRLAKIDKVMEDATEALGSKDELKLAEQRKLVREQISKIHEKDAQALQEAAQAKELAMQSYGRSKDVVTKGIDNLRALGGYTSLEKITATVEQVEGFGKGLKGNSNPPPRPKNSPTPPSRPKTSPPPRPAELPIVNSNPFADDMQEEPVAVVEPSGDRSESGYSSGSTTPFMENSKTSINSEELNARLNKVKKSSYEESNNLFAEGLSDTDKTRVAKLGEKMQTGENETKKKGGVKQQVRKLLHLGGKSKGNDPTKLPDSNAGGGKEVSVK